MTPLTSRAATPGRWMSRCLSAAGVVLLAAVPALGLTVLNPGVFSRERAGADEPLPISQVSLSGELLAFDSPTTTLQRANAASLATHATDSAKANAPIEELVLSDWRFTQFHRLSTGGPDPIAEEIALLQQQLMYYQTLLLKLLAQQNNPPSTSPSQ